PDRPVRVREVGIGGGDLDRAHDRADRIGVNAPRGSRVSDEPVDDLAHAPFSASSRLPVQPQEIVLPERDGNGPFRHTIFIRFEMCVGQASHASRLSPHVRPRLTAPVSACYAAAGTWRGRRLPMSSCACATRSPGWRRARRTTVAYSLPPGFVPRSCGTMTTSAGGCR